MMTPAGYNVQGLAFGQGGVEISYVTEMDTDTGTGIQEIRTVAIPAHLVSDSLGEVLDACDQLIKEMSVARRQPPPTIKA